MSQDAWLHPAAISRGYRRRLRAGIATITAVGLVAAGATVVMGEVTTANTDTLKGVGPAGPYGFPVYYEDASGLKLEQCLDANEAMCDPAFLVGEGLDPERPLHIGTTAAESNWPGESFYFQSEAVADTTAGGDATLVMALEATFANEEPKDGDQVVFGRLRIRVDTPAAGTYTVTHPYGVDTFEVDTPADGINFTEDITPAPQNFGLALRSRIAPFLQSTAGPVETDTGTYLADPAVPTAVTGSPFETNFFRVTGPDGQVIAETDQFTLLGKVSTNSGIDPVSATVSEDGDGMFLNVHARAGANDAITVSGEGLAETTLAAGGADGTDYFARVPLTSVPDKVTLLNESDKPVATKTVTVTDLVTVTGAIYSTASQELVITATTSDAVESPQLSYGGQALADGRLTVSGLAIPPASVTVTSAAGGSDTAPVSVTGGALGTAEATTAIAVAPSTTLAGKEVTLDGSSSVNATSYAWAQTKGTPVTLADPSAATTTFTAPDQAAELAFTLTTRAPDGTSVVSEPVTVTVTAADQTPTAVATASTTDPLVGQNVTIDGSGSTNAARYSWTQTGGTPTAFDATAPSFTFAMPSGKAPVTFQLVVTSPNGTVSAPATVTVTAKADILAVTAAEVRTGRNEWRVAGTATITNNNTVSVWTQTATGGKGQLIGTATVEAPAAGATEGIWSVRTRNGVAPAGVTRLIVESSRGGFLKDVTFTSRR
ncbi:hypothetical protein NCCP1664_07600 [Zafaria cholistanensis]|uniref:PKD/Chitinase domain-containing protein n=1 Tax=Zafaria cholistanensis TaxID=1682741 RepID=A0A5A7NMT4_9MICC|nr:hypothetical protein [Zafaria cholistanensis]GER22263.1 hypothetical protein NCCP1664_07600 [Zafaria cholistanensis]